MTGSTGQKRFRKQNFFLLISVWDCLGGCLLWSAKVECKSIVEYSRDFFVRAPPEMVLWEVRQLWPFHLHCCFESRISLGEKSKLQATVTENRLSDFDTSWLNKRKRKKFFEFYRQMKNSCFNWTLMNKPHAIRQLNIHACITLEKNCLDYWKQCAASCSSAWNNLLCSEGSEVFWVSFSD